jgi:hypothetical protein
VNLPRIERRPPLHFHSAFIMDGVKRYRFHVEAPMGEFWLELLLTGAALVVMAGICAFEGWSR